MKQTKSLTGEPKPPIMPNDPRNRVTRVGQQPCRQFRWKHQRPKCLIQMTRQLLRSSTRERIRNF